MAKLGFMVSFITAIVMLIVGFIVPPTGVIDGSVLTAVGEIFGFATLFQLPSLIHGRSVEFHHGKTSINLGDDD